MVIRASKPAYNIEQKLKELDYAHVPYEKMPAGSVIQFKYYTSTNATISTGNTTFTDAGLTASFYPKFANSIIKVEIKSRRFNLVDGNYMRVAISRDGGNTYIGDDMTQINPRDIWYQNANSSAANQISYGLYFPWIDFPNTTEKIDYKIYFAADPTSGSTVYLADSGGVQLYITEIKQ
jgi:hypothetical protein